MAFLLEGRVLGIYKFDSRIIVNIHYLHNEKSFIFPSFEKDTA